MNAFFLIKKEVIYPVVLSANTVIYVERIKGILAQISSVQICPMAESHPLTLIDI